MRKSKLLVALLGAETTNGKSDHYGQDDEAEAHLSNDQRASGLGFRSNVLRLSVKSRTTRVATNPGGA